MAVLLIILLVGVLTYAFRSSLAEMAAQRWCNDKQLACQLSISEIGFTRVRVSDVSVRHQDKPGRLILEMVELDLAWPRLSSPVIETIRVENPVVSASYLNDRFSVAGLEDLLSGGGGGAAPEVIVSDGRFDLTMSAGVISAAFDVSAQWPQRGEAHLVFAPAQLERGSDTLRLEQGDLRLKLNEGLFDGAVSLHLSEAQFEGFRTDTLRLTANMSDQTPRTMRFDASAREVAAAGLAWVQDVQASGEIGLTAETGFNTSNPLDLIERLIADIETGELRWQTYSARQAALELAMNASPENGLHTVSAETRLTEAMTDQINADAITLSFEGDLNSTDQRLTGDGSVLLSGAAVSPSLLDQVFTRPDGNAPWNGHIEAFQDVSRRALADFTFGGDYRLAASGRRDWSIALSEAVALSSASGVSAIITPNGIAPPVSLDQDALTVAGLLSVAGGGGPRLTIDLNAFRFSDQEVGLGSGGITLDPWRVSGNEIGARLNRLNAVQTSEGLRLETLGELRFDGEAFGIAFNDSRVFGGIEALRGSEGWRVETQGQDCLGLDIASTRTAGNLTLSDIRLAICPEDGRFIRQQDGRPTGQIRLGDVSVPFNGNSFSGVADLYAATLTWQAGDELDLDIQAETLSLPMIIGTRSLELETAQPRAAFSFTEETRLSVGLSETVLSGALVPANVTLPRIDLQGVLNGGGFTGSATSANVRITDQRSDPLYQPLLANLVASFTGRQMQLTGPVRLVSPNATVGSVRLDIDLLSLNGEAVLQSRPLLFEPGGLQPKHLTDRLRAILTNGRGTLSGTANISVRSGRLSGTGTFQADEFGFDTFRLGAVDGVSGTLFFSDLMGLTSAPGQVFTIGALNPGVPLADGTVTLQVLNGREAVIEQAKWPFAGGALEVQPTRWTISGESDVINVTAREIELADLIEALTLPDVEAEGTVSGTFPIELVDGNAFVREARLVADKKGGRISYTGSGLEAAGQGNDTVAAAFTALEDFRFSVLELGANGNLIGSIIISLDLLGYNPDVLGGSEFRFKIDVDSELAQLIKSGQRATTSTWITEAVLGGRSR
ncbi:MAG: YdbH domain-containing protein [Pseudomonadota bacterium]